MPNLLTMRVPAGSDYRQFSDPESETLYADIWTLLAPYLDIQRIPRSEWETTENGTIFEALETANPRIDVSSWLWSETEYTKQTLKASNVVYHMPVIFHLAEQGTKGESLNFMDDERTLHKWIFPVFLFEVFSGNLWTSVAGVLCTLLMVNALMRTALPLNRGNSSLKSTWSWFWHFVYQQTDTRVRWGTSSALPFVLVLTGTFCVHSLILYQGCLLGQLVHFVKYEPKQMGLEDLAELIERGEVVLNLVGKHFPLASELQNAKMHGDEYNTLNRVLETNPPIYVKENEVFHAGKRVATSTIITGAFRSIEYGAKCDLLLVRTPYRHNMVFYLSPNVSEELVEALNEAIRQAQAEIVGILEAYVRGPMVAYDRCRRIRSEEAQPVAGDPIPLVKLSGMFTVWLLGLGAAVFTLTVEWCRSRMAGLFTDT